jgi:hypothetical protein
MVGHEGSEVWRGLRGREKLGLRDLEAVAT